MVDGFEFHVGFLSRLEQEGLRDIIEAAIVEAPALRPCMPGSGRPFSVRMTNLGELGWIADRKGYRYDRLHPETGRRWPAIPGMLVEVWQKLTGYPAPPQACLVNLYDRRARLGLHRDEDEEDRQAPVVSISLGDTAVFRLGGLGRKDPTRSMRLASGDAVVLGGKSRHCFHGIDRIIPGSSTLLPGGGRINLTLRRVSPP